MGDSPTINLLVYTIVGVPALNLSIGLQNCRCYPKHFLKVYTPFFGSPIYNVMFYTSVGGSPIALTKLLHN